MAWGPVARLASQRVRRALSIHNAMTGERLSEEQWKQLPEETRADLLHKVDAKMKPSDFPKRDEGEQISSSPPTPWAGTKPEEMKPLSTFPARMKGVQVARTTWRYFETIGIGLATIVTTLASVHAIGAGLGKLGALNGGNLQAYKTLNKRVFKSLASIASHPVGLIERFAKFLKKPKAMSGKGYLPAMAGAAGIGAVAGLTGMAVTKGLEKFKTKKEAAPLKTIQPTA